MTELPPPPLPPRNAVLFLASLSSSLKGRRGEYEIQEQPTFRASLMQARPRVLGSRVGGWEGLERHTAPQHHLNHSSDIRQAAQGTSMLIL